MRSVQLREHRCKNLGIAFALQFLLDYTRT
jgi:hypothetical protein